MIQNKVVDSSRTMTFMSPNNSTQPQSNLEKNHCINRLVYGTTVQMIKKLKKKPSQYTFFVNPQTCNELFWINRSKQRLKKIGLTDITSISTYTEVHKKDKASTNTEQLETLKVSYGKDEKIVLVFENQNAKEQFWKGLQHFVDKVQKEEDAKTKDNQAFFTREVFYKHDRDGSGGLDKREVKELVKTLNLKATDVNVDELIDHYDTDNNEKLDYQEFTDFLNHLLKKNEVLPVFEKYASQSSKTKDEPMMTPQGLMDFYEKEQNQILTLKEVCDLHDKYDNASRTDPIISFADFSVILFSPVNKVFNPENFEKLQDLTRPLTDYYINSSHNTYLMSNQLTGVSSVQAYITALKRGCRCVELDLWDGPDSEPIVYHGHTMTTKITFEDIIKTVKEHAFTVNPYPLILSFEMHCGLAAQKRISEILLEHIGDMIYAIPLNHDTYTHYPSPASLQHKFIIKCKGKLVFGRAVTNLGVDGDSFDYEPTECDEVMDGTQRFANFHNLSRGITKEFDLKKRNFVDQLVVIQPDTIGNSLLSARGKTNLDISNQPDKQQVNKTVSERPLEQSTTTKAAPLNLQKEEEKSSPKKNPPSLQTFKTPISSNAQSPNSKATPASISDLQPSATGVGSASPREKKSKKKDKKKHEIHEGLNLLYGMIGSKLDLTKTPSVWEICSLVEEKVETLFKAKLAELVEYHKRNFTRTYPSNLRISSSNYDPLPAWGMGAQIVALNFQYLDEPMLLNYAKFQRNGGNKCGYVLKPSYMLHDSEKSTYAEKLHQIRRPVKQVTIQVISAQALKPIDSDSKKNVNPFVEVKMRGLEFDEKQNPSFKTHTVHDSAFHPVWSGNEKSNTFSFTVAVPEFATFVFAVYGEDRVKKQKLGRYAIDLENIRQGYRVVPLMNHELRRIKNSCLFCHFSIVDL